MMMMMMMLLMLMMMLLQHSTHGYLSCALQDESHYHGHVHFVPQNTVFFDVRTCRRRRRGQTDGFAREITIVLDVFIYNVSSITNKLHITNPIKLKS